ncbi:MAG: c-type cytochrome [Gammaproteobacteria bacterium]
MNKRLFLHFVFLFISASVATAQTGFSVDLNEIDTSRLQTVAVTVEHDPVYRSVKHFQGYALTEILKLLILPETFEPEASVVVFTAKDGYRVAMAYDDIQREQGYIVFKDTDAEATDGWQSFKFGNEVITPAPFYLVWQTPGLDKWRYPWPFQLVGIGLETASVFYGAAAPKKADSHVRRGFNLFAKYCIGCHSVNRAGGHVGPELNVSKNVTEYYEARKLTGFILNAPAYRPDTKMPAFKGVLSQAQTTAIVRYLEHMTTEKIDAAN